MAPGESSSKDDGRTDSAVYWKNNLEQKNLEQKKINKIWHRVAVITRRPQTMWGRAPPPPPPAAFGIDQVKAFLGALPSRADALAAARAKLVEGARATDRPTRFSSGPRPPPRVPRSRV
jgi:hypothetical protein